ncbi:MAG: hypothetical protein V3V96_06655 [Acidiferrobacterales bacterium]
MSKVNLKKCFDGMYRRFEIRAASTITDLDTGLPLNLEDPTVPAQDAWDWDVWVCTGVFKRRKDAFSRGAS